MYAVVTTDDITDRTAADKTVVEQVMPMVKQAPGFVGGYWVRFDGGQGASVVVFETEEQARAGAPKVGGGAPGVTFTNVMVGEVAGHA
jgi:heme-degrading monooxygenase HmoA